MLITDGPHEIPCERDRKKRKLRWKRENEGDVARENSRRRKTKKNEGKGEFEKEPEEMRRRDEKEEKGRWGGGESAHGAQGGDHASLVHSRAS